MTSELSVTAEPTTQPADDAPQPGYREQVRQERRAAWKALLDPAIAVKLYRDALALARNRRTEQEIKAHEQTHCANPLCGREIPRGRRGRFCKPCRGVPLSDSEAEQNAILKATSE